MYFPHIFVKIYAYTYSYYTIHLSYARKIYPHLQAKIYNQKSCQDYFLISFHPQ